MRWLLPVPDGPQTHSTSCAVDPFQRAERLLGRGGDHGPVGFPGVERLAGRQARRAAAGPDRRLVAAGGLLGEQHA